jgi:hypothetical protein
MKLTPEKLRLTCINLSEEISRGDDFLCNKDVTIFNSSIIQLKNSSNLLIASRGWYGDVRSWSGINFVIISLFNKELKKIKQNILDIDPKAVENKKLKFKELKDKVISHEESLTVGPEDPRLFYHGKDVYILINELNKKKQRHMFVSKVDIDNLTYGEKIEICKSLSTDFEKNWGPFIYKDKLHMIYDINPLKIFEFDDDFNCKLKMSVKDVLLNKLNKSYPDLQFHIRNSTNLIDIGNDKFLGMGHGVLDYKGNTEINKYLLPSFDSSKYSKEDKEYFKKFFKLYTGFFYKLDMSKNEITEISPFFQLPNYESKNELIFFPTSIYLDERKFVNISYNVGDNRSYYLKLHLDVINISLYEKENIDFQMNHNINQNYYIELVRNIRKILGYPLEKRDYYRFGDVNRIYASRKKRLSNRRKRSKKSKRRTKKSK